MFDQLDNIGPIVLFILYLAISAWAKQKKAQRRAPKKENEGPIPEETSSSLIPKMESIFDQLKKELFEAGDEEVIDIPYEEYQEPDFEQEPEEEPILSDEPQFVEGSKRMIKHFDSGAESPAIEVNPLDRVLEPYSTIEQGIILHEILGKSRALQKDDEWFHKS